MTNAGADLCFSAISEVGERIRRREVSPVELVGSVLDRIERHDGQMRAYITVIADAAIKDARRAEREIAAGRYRGALHGIPIAVKDNIRTRGTRTTCASLVLPDWLPDEDASVVAKLRAAGAVLVGKANLFEYAFSMSPAFPPPLNPWNPEKSSSGSSSGSAVAVAIGMAHASIGSDTGGSGRQPASANGVIGLKPTFGRVDTAGVVPLSWSLDTVSVFSRTTLDASIMLDAISERQPNGIPTAEHVAAHGSGDRPLSGRRLARGVGYSVEGIDPDVDATIDAAVDVLRRLGASIEDVELPHIRTAGVIQRAIMLPEAATFHHEAHRSSAEQFGEAAVARLDLGAVIPATAYLRAQQFREVIVAEYRELFTRYDAIVGPANPTRVGRAGEWNTTLGDRVIDLRDVAPEYTGIHNLAGLPAIVIPAGLSSEGTPIGLQIAGPWWAEGRILEMAHAFEVATDWHRYRPPLPDGLPEPVAGT